MWWDEGVFVGGCGLLFCSVIRKRRGCRAPALVHLINTVVRCTRSQLALMTNDLKRNKRNICSEHISSMFTMPKARKPFLDAPKDPCQKDPREHESPRGFSWKNTHPQNTADFTQHLPTNIKEKPSLGAHKPATFPAFAFPTRSRRKQTVQRARTVAIS